MNMRGQELSLLKWSGLLLVLTALLLAGCSRSGEAEKSDETMMQMEQVASLYQSMPGLVDIVGGDVRKEFGAGVDADLPLLRQSVVKAFDPADLLARVRRELKAVDAGGGAEVPAFLAAANDFIRTQSAVEAESRVDPGKVIQSATDAYEVRADKGRIDALAGAMAAADIQVEGTLLGLRLQGAAALRHLEKPVLWQGLDDQGRDRYADQFTRRTRAEGDANHSPPRYEIARFLAIQRLTIILLRLPEPSLKALEDFYNSDLGKAKRKALVAAVAAQSDADTKQMMVEYLRQLR
ncbi:hypothetical protein SAMN05880556_101240 [Azospirillum sp. RU38E]|jgi:hypothetical protein|nr:hypothetical protein SAMN05880556_101240 [Azospirillum sp. RU38E]SNS03014.1 hypothetical protein SAMN05880591_101240 [Azospirillum sp. RU37A]